MNRQAGETKIAQQGRWQICHLSGFRSFSLLVYQCLIPLGYCASKTCNLCNKKSMKNIWADDYFLCLSVFKKSFFVGKVYWAFSISLALSFFPTRFPAGLERLKERKPLFRTKNFGQSEVLAIIRTLRNFFDISFSFQLFMKKVFFSGAETFRDFFFCFVVPIGSDIVSLKTKERGKSFFGVFAFFEFLWWWWRWEMRLRRLLVDWRLTETTFDQLLTDIWTRKRTFVCS